MVFFRAILLYNNIYQSELYMNFFCCIILLLTIHISYADETFCPYDLNQLISQRILAGTRSLDTTHHMYPQEKRIGEIITGDGSTRITYYPQTVVVEQGIHQRLLNLPKEQRITRGWTQDIQTVSLVMKDAHGNISTDSYRYCHMADIETLTHEQQRLCLRACKAWQTSHPHVLASKDEQELYLTLPESLRHEALFKIAPSDAPQSGTPTRIVLYTFAALRTLVSSYMGF